MNRLVLAATVLAMAGTSFAQSWSPLPKYASEAGKGYQYYFGRYSQGRFQFADGNFRNTALVVTKVSMRIAQNNRYYSDYYRMGRSWSNVKIDISPADLSTFNTNFSNNQTSTPTNCYSGTMSWPTIPVGASPGGLANMPIQAPLTTPYINAGGGTDDMAVDFRFTGGTLANNFNWSSTTTRYYYTDGYLITSFASGPQRFFHDPNTNGCVDSMARPLFYRSYTYQYVYRYSATYRTTSFKNKLRVYNYTYYGAPNKPFVNAVDFLVNTAGVPFGSGCEKLYLAASPAMLLYPGSMSAFGYGGQNLMGFTNGLVPYSPAFLGAEVFCQSTFNDSVTGAVKLSAASSAKVPTLGLQSNAAAKRKCAYSNTHLPRYQSDFFYVNPIIRYN
jgi:hypothetical protein